MNRRNEKAITLIALVVTIVVLLILAGVSISMLSGENGIITRAKEAKIANEKGKVLDIAELARMNRVIEEKNKISDETSLTAIFAELSKEGYEVKTITNAGEELKGIIIQDTTGAEITELNIQQGKETTIKVNLDLQNGTQKHYVLIQGKYYEIAIENGKVVLGENGKKEESLNGKEYTIKLTPPSTGAKLVVGTTEITEETTIVDGAEIKVEAGQNIAEYGFNIKVENTTYEEDVVVNVVANPLYATGLTLTTVDNETKVEAGSEVQIIATIVPETATDEVEWRVISGSATIDNTGLLKVGEDAEGNTSIEVGAKCKRSDGTTSTVEEKTITITVEENAKIAKSDLIIGTKDESGEITVTNGKYTLQVGDYINYSPTDGVEATTITSYSTENGYGDQEFSSGYTGKWRVLGISEEGQIVIVPESVIKTTSDGYYYLKGQDGYVNAVDELDKISAIFAKGYGASGKARSVTIEDINSITGYNPANVGKYDPEQTGSGTRYGSGNLNEYGNKVTYYWKGDNYPYYTYTKLDGTPGTPGNLSKSHSKFNWFDNITKEKKTSTKATLDAIVTDGDTTKMKEITTLESDYYKYYLTSLKDTSGSGEGLTSGTKAYTTLCNGSGQYYWLGSPYVGTYSDVTTFGVRGVGNGGVFCLRLHNSYDYDFSDYDCVRPAVYLNSDIQLTGNSTDGWTIVKN